MPHFYDICAGPIEGLYLPPVAWKMLLQENIGTIDQLRVNADRLEQFDGIEAWIAQVIRQALARFVPPLGKKQYDSWSA